MKRRGELRMIERAINQGWPTSPEQQKRATDLAVEVMDDPNATNREWNAAARVIIAWVRSNTSEDWEITKRYNDAMRPRS